MQEIVHTPSAEVRHLLFVSRLAERSLQHGQADSRAIKRQIIVHPPMVGKSNEKIQGTIKATMGAESRESRRGDDYFARVARS